MRRIRNDHGAEVVLVRFSGEPEPGQLFVANLVEDFRIPAGATVEVEEHFLGNAQALFDEKILVDVESEIRSLIEAPEAPAAPAETAPVAPEPIVASEPVADAPAETAPEAPASGKKGRGAK